LVARPIEGLYSSLSSLTRFTYKRLVARPVETSIAEEDLRPSAFIPFV